MHSSRFVALIVSAIFGSLAIFPTPLLCQTESRPVHEQVFREMDASADLKPWSARTWYRPENWRLGSGPQLFWKEFREKSVLGFVDGKQIGGSYQDITLPQFSSDGKHIAFAVKSKGSWHVVIDGQDRPDEYGELSSLAVSDDGTSFAYASCKRGRCSLIVNDKQEAVFDSILPGSLAFRDPNTLVYIARRERKFYLVTQTVE